ncbi:MAG: hypothetical protein AAGE80_17935 [Pseudomonadota bacterium]
MTKKPKDEGAKPTELSEAELEESQGGAAQLALMAASFKNAGGNYNNGKLDRRTIDGMEAANTSSKKTKG